MEEIDWKIKYTRVSEDNDRLNAEKVRLEAESESRKNLAETLAEYVHALKKHPGSFCFCPQQPCDQSHRILYGTRNMTTAKPGGDDIEMKDGPCRRCHGLRTEPTGCFGRGICDRCKGSGKERRMYVNGILFPEEWERTKRS